MKTIITIPDDLFSAAEDVARHLSVSRSELYARALEQFLTVRRADDITQRLNEVYTDEPARIDPILARMQFRGLPYDEW